MGAGVKRERERGRGRGRGVVGAHAGLVVGGVKPVDKVPKVHGTWRVVRRGLRVWVWVGSHGVLVLMMCVVFYGMWLMLSRSNFDSLCCVVYEPDSKRKEQ